MVILSNWNSRIPTLRWQVPNELIIDMQTQLLEDVEKAPSSQLRAKTLLAQNVIPKSVVPFRVPQFWAITWCIAYVLRDFLLVNLLTRRTDRGFRTWALKKSMDVPCSLGYRRLENSEGSMISDQHESVGCVTVIVVVTAVCCACVCCGCCGCVLLSYSKQPNKMQALSFVHFQIEDFPKDAELAQRMQAARAFFGDSWHCFLQLFCNMENERNFETYFLESPSTQLLNETTPSPFWEPEAFPFFSENASRVQQVQCLSFVLLFCNASWHPRQMWKMKASQTCMAAVKAHQALERCFFGRSLNYPNSRVTIIKLGVIWMVGFPIILPYYWGSLWG